MANIYDEPINKHVDWGGDESTGGEPVSGRRVQEFIKDTLETKFGCQYYDTITGLYLQFADEENRNLYLSDRVTYSDLLLGSFQGFAPYVVYTELVSPTEKAVLEGSTGITLDFKFQVQDSSGSPLADGVKVIYTFNNAGNTKVATKYFSAGAGSTLGYASLNVDEYLSAGVNDISVKISGRNTSASKTLIYTWTVVKLTLTTSFEVSSPVAPTDDIVVPYYLSGLGTKRVQFWIDGVQYPTEDIVADAEIGKDFYIPNVYASGKHTLQIRAYLTIGEEPFWSSTLYREFVISGTTGKWITIAQDFAPGFLVNAEKTNLQLNVVQYSKFTTNWGYVASDTLDRTITWKLDGVVVATREGTSGVLSPLSFAPSVAKTVPQSLVAVIEGETPLTLETYSMMVTQNPDIHEETEALALKLSAFGKYNSDADRDQWTYNGIDTTFTNVEWTDLSGWNGQALVLQGNARAQVNYKPFSSGHPAVTSGLTFEIEFETFNIDDEDAVVAKISNGGAGITITSNSAVLKSNANREVKTNFKDSERIKLAFVINRINGAAGNEDHIAFIQNNGIRERAITYATNDAYSNDAFIELGSSLAGIKIYSIRSYYKALTVNQEFNNFAIDSDDTSAVLARNDVYTEGTTSISLTKMEGILPVLKMTGPIHRLLESQSKETTITVDAEFTNPQDPTRNWWGTGLQLKLQGTSSLRYPRKNFKIYMKKGASPVVYDADGNVITDWAMKANAVPCHTFTLKADFSDSSCTHNSTVARLYGDLEPRVVVNSNYVLRTPPQKVALEGQFEQATGKPFPYTLRTTPDSFAMVVFYRESVDDEYVCAGQYNFLNDKGNEYLYGFRSIYANGDNPWDKTAPKIWDNVNTHCFEVLNNTDSTGLCEWKDSSLFFVEDPQHPGHSYWEQTWESRYPEAEGTETKEEMDALAQSLYQLHSWMSSCYAVDQGREGSLAKFYQEQSQHLDLNFCASYYSYFMRFGAVDQVNKNMMITTYDGVHWFPIRYDNDTILGQRNDARLIYDYTIDRQSRDPEVTTDYAYAGHESWFWNALEAQTNAQTYPNGFMVKYVPDVDAGLYSAGLTYDATVQYFDVTTSDKWCERMYNDNGTYKYISPYISSSVDFLYALQGKRQSHRHWWLRNRFDLYDAKFVTGEYSSKAVEMVAIGTPASTEFSFKAGKTNYYGWGIAKQPQQVGDYKTKGQVGYFSTPRQLAVGDPVYIYAANCIEELNLSAFAQYITNLDVSGAYDSTVGTRLKKLILGTPTSGNIGTPVFGGFRNMSRLEYLDVSGFQGMTTFDLTGMSSLKTFIALGSGLTLFNCPSGLNFDRLDLPQSVRGITLDQVTWDPLHFAFTPTNNLTYVSFTKMKGSYVRNFLSTWIENIKQSGTFAGKTLNLSILKEDPWTGMEVQELLDYAAFDVHSIRGRFVIGRAITSEEMTDLTDAFGPTIWDPNAPLVIDAVESLVIGCDTAYLYAGNSAQFTAVAFPVGGMQHAVHFEISGESPSGTPEDPVYVKGNATLHKNTGLLETVEDATPDNEFTVVAIDETTSLPAGMVYTVHKRSYPESVEISGPSAILSPGTYEFTTATYPVDTNGTLQSFEWLVTNKPYISIVSQTAQKLTIRVLSVPDTYDVIQVTVSLVYKNGALLTDQTSFVAHARTQIVDASSNYALSVALNQLGVTASPLLGWDIEAYLWNEPLYLYNVTTVSQITSFVGTEGVRVYKYFANCPNFDFEDVVNLVEEQGLDLTLNYQLTDLNLTGTQVPEITFGPALLRAAIPGVTRIKVPEQTAAFNVADIDFTPEEITSVELINSPFAVNTTHHDVLNWFYYEIYKKQVPSVMPEPTTSYYSYYSSNNSILYSADPRITYNYYDDDIQRGYYELTGTDTFYRAFILANLNHYTAIDTNCLTIETGCFASSTSLTEFIADSATSISGQLFQNCTALVTVSLAECTLAAEGSQFLNCTALKNVLAPKLRFQSGFGSNAFKGSGIETISQSSLHQDTGVWLRDLVIVPNSCFEGCAHLVTAGLPNVTTCGTSVFKGCTYLVDGSLASCTTFGESAFESCSSLECVSKSGYERYADGIILCENLVSLPNKCFKGCVTLYEGVLDLQNYGDECFAGCTSLACVYSATSDEGHTGLCIGNGALTILGEKCFYQCASLTQAIMNFVHEFKAYALAGCTLLSELHTNITAPTAASTAFGDGSLDYAYTGCDTGLDHNGLYLFAGYTGYNVAPWTDPLCTAAKCNFQITTESASCHITYKSPRRLTNVETKPQVTHYDYDVNTHIGHLDLNTASIPDNFFNDYDTPTKLCATYLQEFSSDCISLGQRACRYCANLVSVTLNSCTVLNTQCFYSCGLTSFDGSNVTTLNGSEHFYNCRSLTTANFSRVTSLSGSMFRGCINLANINFDNVRTFNGFCCYGCTSLTGITQPVEVCTYVGNYSFYGCTNLATFPFSAVEVIGGNDNNYDYHCFSGTALTDVQLPACTTIGRRSFNSCSHLVEVNAPVCTWIGSVVFTSSTVERVYLPLLTSSQGALFCNDWGAGTASRLSEIDISSLTVINNDDFRAAYNLHVDLDLQRVTSIAPRAFYASGIKNITDLTNITTIPDSNPNESIGPFRDCGSLETVNLPSIIDKIGDCAFLYDSHLRDINLSSLNDCTKIGYLAFYGCNQLTGVINMPNLTVLGSRSFYAAGLTGIENLGTLTEIPANPSNIGQGTFHGCYLQYAKLPSTLRRIGAYAFYNCPNLESVSFYTLYNVTHIEWAAFGYDGSTQSGKIKSAVSLPNLTELSNRTFYRQAIGSIDDLGHLTILHRPDNDYAAFRETSIRSLVVPKSMARMEYNNFHGCNQLRYITALSNVPAIVNNSTDSSTFYGCNANLKKVAVPAGFKEDYKTAWEYLTQSTFCELPYEDSDYTLVVYNFGDVTDPCPVLNTITGVTEMQIWRNNDWETIPVATTVTLDLPGFYKLRFITGSELSQIDNTYACRVWTATNVTSVAASAFMNAPMLTEFHGTNVTAVGANCFNHCDFMETLELPALTTMANSCFANMGNGVEGASTLKTIIFGQSQPVCPESMDNPFLDIPERSAVGQVHDTQTGDGWDWTGISTHSDYYYWQYLVQRGWARNPITINFHSMVDLEIPIAGEVTGYSYDATEQIGSVTLSTSTPSVTPFAGNTDVEVLWSDNQIFSLPADFISGCTQLRYVWFPTVTTLANGALRNATMLRTVVLPRLTAIPNDGFSGDGGLYDKIHFDRVITVGDKAFYNCSAMHSIDLPVCTSVGESAFENTELASIDMPSLQTIGTSAFKGTAAYEALLPECTTIGATAFEDCGELITFEFGSTQPTADSTAFNGIASNGTLHHNATSWDWTQPGWSYLQNHGWNTVQNYIEYHANLQLVFDPQHSTEIQSHTFDSESGVGVVVLTTNHPTVPTFEDQDTVTEVTISSTIDQLPDEFFSGCLHLVQINMNLGQITAYGDTFLNLPNAGMIRVFNYSEWNTSAAGWSVLFNNKSWQFDNRVLYYSATEKAVLYTEDEVEYHVYDSFLRRGAIKMTTAEPNATPLRNNTQALEIHGLFTKLPDYFVSGCDAYSISFSGATQVGAYAIQSCSNVLSVDLSSATKIGERALQMNIQMVSCITSSSLYSIEAYAFYRDYVLQNIVATGVSNIGEYAFYQCYSITNFTSTAMRNIGSYAFQYCTGLVTLHTSSSAHSCIFGTYAFYGCSSLSDAVVDIDSVSASCFSYCTSLTTLTLTRAYQIGNNGFDGCNHLVTCYIPNCSTIGYRAFYNCSALTTIGPSIATSIGAQAFNGCPLFTNTFNFPSVTTIGSYPFDGCHLFTGNIVLDNLSQSNTAWFYNCEVDSLDFSGNINVKTLNIGDNRGMFNNARNLRSIVLPSGLKTMGTTGDGDSNLGSYAGTLGRCYSLRSVGPANWQNNIEKLNYNALQAARSLHIDINMPNLNWLGNYIFDSSGITAIENLGTIDHLISNYNNLEANPIENCIQLAYVKLPDVWNLSTGFLLNCYGLRNLRLKSFTPPDHTYNASEYAGALYEKTWWWQSWSTLDCINFYLPVLAEIRIPCGSYEEYYYWDKGINADKFDYWAGTTARTKLVEGPYEETEWHTVVYDVTGSYGQPMTIVNTVDNISAMQIRHIQWNEESGQYTGADWEDVTPTTTYTFNRRPVGIGTNPRTDSGMRVVRFKTVSGLAQELAGITTIKRVYTPSAVVSANAFSGCTGLVTIKAPNATRFGSGSFNGCANLILIEVDAQPVALADTFSGVTSTGVVRIYGVCDFTATGWSVLSTWASKDRTEVRMKSVCDVAVDDDEYYKIRRFVGHVQGAGLYEKGETATLTCIPGRVDYSAGTPRQWRRLYDFVEWSDGETNATHSPIVLNSDTEINAITRKRRFRGVTVGEYTGDYRPLPEGLHGTYTTTMPYSDEQGGYFTWDNAWTIECTAAPEGYKFDWWRVAWGWGSVTYTRTYHPGLNDSYNAEWFIHISENSDNVSVICHYSPL